MLIKKEITKNENQALKNWSVSNLNCENFNHQNFINFGLLNLFENASLLLDCYPPDPKLRRVAYFNDSNDEILGFTILELLEYETRNELFVHHLLVNPNLIRRGIGTAIIIDLTNNANKYFNNEIDSIIYCVNEDNKPCINLLNKLNFNELETNLKIKKYELNLKEKRNELW